MARRMNWEIQLARPLRTHHCGLPPLIRTLGDAIDLIDEDLPAPFEISGTRQ
jgi:hypothetical protein